MASDICILNNEAYHVSEEVVHLSSFLNAPINPTNPEEFQFSIYIKGEDWLLKDKQGRKFSINFDENHIDYQRKQHRGKNELIAKALGASKGVQSVLDLTAGLGVDSVFLTQLGFKVIAIERNPVIYSFLKHALDISKKIDKEKLQFVHFDSLDFLQNEFSKHIIESIYFDPMYPHKNKTALPKQEMLVFRNLVGDDNDSKEVLKLAIQLPVQRVVVKRPLHSEALLEPVSHSFEGKAVRFDSYWR